MTVLTSRQLVERYELHGADLFRWRHRGWIRPDQVRQGGSGGGLGNQGSFWPDWTDRMVRLLLLDRVNTEHGNHGERGRMLEAVADALAEDPEVRWVVFVDGADPVACRHNDEVAALVGDARWWATFVGIPA